jgi:hypothetical protein
VYHSVGLDRVQGVSSQFLYNSICALPCEVYNSSMPMILYPILSEIKCLCFMFYASPLWRSHYPASIVWATQVAL